MRSQREYITLLRDYFRTKAIAYGVERMGLFGSVSRNEQNDESDIDIVYEGEANIFTRIRMKKELEQLFDCKVDIIRLSKQINSSLFGKSISKDLIYV